MEQRRPYEILYSLIESLSEYEYNDIRISQKNYKKAFLEIQNSFDALNIDAIEVCRSFNNLEIIIHINYNPYRMSIVAEDWTSEIYKSFIESLSLKSLLFLNTSESLDSACLKLSRLKSEQNLTFVNIYNINKIIYLSPNFTNKSKVFFKSSDNIVIGNVERNFIIKYFTDLGRFDLLLDIFY